MKVLILKKRKDFVRAAKGYKSVMPTLILQAAQSLSMRNKEVLQDGCYLGFTATKKLGKAHLRNRTKRRLRAAARLSFPELAKAGLDYVLIGRYNTADAKFERLVSDMKRAIGTINSQIEAEETAHHEISDDCAD